MVSKESTLLFLLILIICCNHNGSEIKTKNTKKKITIIHTNDTHARVVEGRHDGMGFAKIFTIMNKIKTQNENVLTLDAGDTLHGKTFAILEEGESIVQVFNTMSYEAMVLGNHDFNYGQDRLLALIKMADFDVISANTRYSNGKNFVNPYVIKKINDIRVGIFGITTPETKYMTHPNNTLGLEFDDPTKTAKEIVNQLKSQVDFIIALCHLGTNTNNKFNSLKVAKEVKGIDLIVDGHSHSVLPSGIKVGETLIASAGEYGKYLGVVQLHKLRDKVIHNARLISKTDACMIPEDETVKDTINTIISRQETILLEIIGVTLTDLDGKRENVRTKETNLGNLITDSMVLLTQADAAIINGGGIRDSIDIGDISIGQIYTVLPFGNYVVTKRFKGKVIKKALEHGTSKYPRPYGAFPHVSKMTYSIDLNRPIGNRVVDIKINGKPIEMEREYIIAVNDFIAVGGDHYHMLENTETIHEYTALDDGLIEYIQLLQTIAPVIENRIKIING